MKFSREPVATVTGKVTGSCRWCYHDNHPQWPSDAERENVEKKPKKSVYVFDETDEGDVK